MDNYNNFNNNGYQQGYPQQNSGYGQAPQQGYNMNKTQPISGWSWGAFMFNMIWGLGNKCYLPLLCFVPVLNIIWIFICGAKGHEWAMNSGTFRTVEEYNAAMSTWDRAGKIVFFVYLIFMVLWIVLFGTIMGSVMTGLSEYF